MQALIFSDVHLEFHPDGGRRFFLSLERTRRETGCDVAVVAGDFSTHSRLAGDLTSLCEIFDHVVYVVGNHEMYGSDFDSVHSIVAGVPSKRLHWLHRSTANIGGRRFIGASLWFPYDPINQIYERLLSDFSMIRGFGARVYQEAAMDRDFLTQNVMERDFVVTHHLPLDACVSRRFHGSPLNRFFVHHLPAAFATNPSWWVHGHTHDSVRIKHGETTVICNPYGYEPHEMNRAFDPSLIVAL